MKSEVVETTGVQVTAEIMLPEKLEQLVHQAYELQDDCPNESSFVKVFMRDAIIAGLKAACNDVIGEKERTIQKQLKIEQDLTYPLAIQFIIETSSKGKSLMERAELAEKVRKQLK